MAYNFVVSLKAENHIQSAYHWYEEQRPGLGYNFIEAVDLSFKAIQSNPLAYSFRRDNIRGCLTKKFPYLVLFYVRGNNIRIVSVFHTSKKPNI